MKSKIIRLPFGAGNLILAHDMRDVGANRFPGGLDFHTNLRAALFRHGKYQGDKDLGSGLVTNVGALALANSFGIASPTGAGINILKLAQFHASGTGVSVAATSDIKLGAPISTVGSPIVTGSQVLSSAANAQKYQTVATLNYDAGGPYAVTEWALLSENIFSATTGSPFTATTAQSGTATGTPYTASDPSTRGQQQRIVEAGTTAVWGYILSNTTSVLTLPAWYKTSDGTAGSTPGATETFTLRPIMWDRKQFGAINVNNGDSIQFTYTLTIVAGG